MLHILVDYEQDVGAWPARPSGSTILGGRCCTSCRIPIKTSCDLEASRKAMIHIMGDLRETTAEIQRREHELRDKQEQLVQAGKLATLGELTTGVAHELNNPLNNIGLFIGNVDRPHRARR